MKKMKLDVSCKIIILVFLVMMMNLIFVIYNIFVSFKFRGVMSFYFFSLSKCLDGWIGFKQSCSLLGETSMTCVDAKVGNGFLVGFTYR